MGADGTNNPIRRLSNAEMERQVPTTEAEEKTSKSKTRVGAEDQDESAYKAKREPCMFVIEDALQMLKKHTRDLEKCVQDNLNSKK